MQARLPAEKLQKAKDLVQTTLNKSTITRNELDTLLGFLCFAAKVVVPGRTFLRRLFNSKIGPTRPFIHINSHIKADLLRWHHSFHYGTAYKLLALRDPCSVSGRMPVGTSESGHTYFKVVRPHTHCPLSKWFLNVIPPGSEPNISVRRR